MSEERKRSKEKIVEIIVALMAKAMATSFEPEREEFLRKADELMEKYAVELTDLNAGNSTEVSSIGHETVWFGEPGKIPSEIRQWKVLLAYAVAEYTFCSILTRQGSAGIVIIGHEGDRLLFKQVWENMAVSMQRLMDTAAAEARKRGVFKRSNPSFTDPMRWRKVYLEQLANRVAIRLQKLHDARLSRMGKIVPYANAVEEYTQNQFRVTKGKGFKILGYDHSPDAALAAYDDAHRVELGVKEIDD